jgi:hypothetical protein
MASAVRGPCELWLRKNISSSEADLSLLVRFDHEPTEIHEGIAIEVLAAVYRAAPIHAEECAGRSSALGFASVEHDSHVVRALKSPTKVSEAVQPLAGHDDQQHCHADASAREHRIE